MVLWMVELTNRRSVARSYLCETVARYDFESLWAVLAYKEKRRDAQLETRSLFKSSTIPSLCAPPQKREMSLKYEFSSPKIWVGFILMTKFPWQVLKECTYLGCRVSINLFSMYFHLLLPRGRMCTYPASNYMVIEVLGLLKPLFPTSLLKSHRLIIYIQTFTVLTFF